MNLLEAEFIPHWIKLTPVIFSLAGAGSSLLIYSMGQRQLFKFKVSLIGRRLYTFLNRKWFFDKVYNEWIAQGALAIGYHVTYKAIDRGIIEMFGPYGISHTVYNVSLKMARVQSGYLYHYATMMMIGIILFVMVVGLWDLVAPWWDGRLLIQFVAATLLLHYYSK
jgi:NADH-ubiquinone oxidoreductase chain 5